MDYDKLKAKVAEVLCDHPDWTNADIEGYMNERVIERTVKISRADELGLGVVKTGHIGMARN